LRPPDGMSALREIVHAAPDYLERHGWLILEHGSDQAAAVAHELVGAASVTYAPTAISPATGASLKDSGLATLHEDIPK